MRTAVIYFGGKNSNISELARGLAQGIEAQGQSVDLIDADLEQEKRLTSYGYIAIGCLSRSFWGGKVDEKIAEVLANSGTLTAKRSFAFVKKSGLRIQKTLIRLMQVMEHEGMFLKNSAVISSFEEAKEIGKKLHIEPSA